MSVRTIRDLLDKLEKSVSPSKTAIIYDGENIPYGIFIEKINQLAASLKRCNFEQYFSFNFKK
ncbi:hypothetical protein KKE26_11475 [bacterium]|nr:hypothetical protein [bacterium]